MTLLNILIVAFSFIAFILPLWDKIYEKRQITRTGYSLFCVAGILMILGLIKGCQDKKTEKENISHVEKLTTNIDTLNSNLKNLRKDRVLDSTKNAEFLIKLESQFKIVRDSLNNRPIQKINNTSIGSARDVFIGKYHFLNTIDKLFYKDLENFSFHVGFTIFSFFRLCGFEELDLDEARLLSHPPSSVRFQMMASNIWTILNHANTEEIVLKNITSQIAKGAKYADVCFSKISLEEESFKIFVNDFEKATQYTGEITDNWNIVRLLLEPFTFGALPPLKSNPKAN